MARSERQKQKAREKQKKKSRQRQAARRKRNAGAGQAQRAGLEQSLSWPTGECYLSEDWYEQGAQLQAVFVRRHSTGQLAAAFFELDLAERGLVSGELVLGEHPGVIQNRVSALSEHKPLMILPAEAVVAAIQQAHDFGDQQGHTPPAQALEALRLMAGVEPDPGTSLLTGAPPPPPDKSAGWLSSIAAKLGL